MYVTPGKSRSVSGLVVRVPGAGYPSLPVHREEIKRHEGAESGAQVAEGREPPVLQHVAPSRGGHGANQGVHGHVHAQHRTCEKTNTDISFTRQFAPPGRTQSRRRVNKKRTNRGVCVRVCASVCVCVCVRTCFKVCE